MPSILPAYLKENREDRRNPAIINKAAELASETFLVGVDPLGTIAAEDLLQTALGRLGMATDIGKSYIEYWKVPVVWNTGPAAR